MREHASTGAPPPIQTFALQRLLPYRQSADGTESAGATETENMATGAERDKRVTVSITFTDYADCEEIQTNGPTAAVTGVDNSAVARQVRQKLHALTNSMVDANRLSTATDAHLWLVSLDGADQEIVSAIGEARRVVGAQQNRAIKSLRRKLQDEARGPGLILTEIRMGYHMPAPQAYVCAVRSPLSEIAHYPSHVLNSVGVRHQVDVDASRSGPKTGRTLLRSGDRDCRALITTMRRSSTRNSANDSSKSRYLLRRPAHAAVRRGGTSACCSATAKGTGPSAGSRSRGSTRFGSSE